MVQTPKLSLVWLSPHSLNRATFTHGENGVRVQVESFDPDNVYDDDEDLDQALPERAMWGTLETLASALVGPRYCLTLDTLRAVTGNAPPDLCLAVQRALLKATPRAVSNHTKLIGEAA